MSSGHVRASVGSERGQWWGQTTEEAQAAGGLRRLWSKRVRWAVTCLNAVAVAALTENRVQGGRVGAGKTRKEAWRAARRWQRWDGQQVCAGLCEAWEKGAWGHGLPDFVLSSGLELPFRWEAGDFRGKTTREKNWWSFYPDTYWCVTHTRKSTQTDCTVWWLLPEWTHLDTHVPGVDSILTLTPSVCFASFLTLCRWKHMVYILTSFTQHSILNICGCHSVSRCLIHNHWFSHSVVDHPVCWLSISCLRNIFLP